MHEEVLTETGKKLFSKLKQFTPFYLAGGTALALQLGHRISVDFDLFSNDEIPKTLLPKVKNIFSDTTIITSINNPDELTIFVDSVKITFIRYPFPVVLPLCAHDGLPLLQTKEIAATKAYTLGRRGEYKDYIDLYFLLANHHISLKEIIMLAEKKYANEFNGRLFLEQLVYLEDIEETDIQFLKEKISKTKLSDFFEKTVQDISLL